MFITRPPAAARPVNAQDQSDAHGQLSENDHIAEPAGAVGIHKELEETAIPIERDHGRSGRRRPKRTVPEAHDALARPVHPRRRRELVPACDQKVVANVHTYDQPQPRGDGALEEKPGNWWILNPHPTVAVADLLER